MMESNDCSDMNAISYFSGSDQILPTKDFKTSEPDGAITIHQNENGSASEKPVSVYTFFKEAAEKYKDVPALVIERDGILRQWTYPEYFDECCIVAKALIKLGLERFHGVCIMGYNSPEWIISSFGAVFAGGFSSGIYTTNSPEACFSVADNCKAQIVIVENKTLLDKFLAVKDRLPNIKALIQWSGEPETPGVIPWAELMSIGAKESDEALQERLSKTAVNQCCTLIYTSGTTGPPKGVMLSHDQITWVPIKFREVYKEDVQDHLISYLPLSHLAGHLAEIYNPIAVGGTVYIAPRDALKGSLGAFLLKTRPTVFLGVPRVWEKMYEKLQSVISNSGIVKKSLMSWAMYHGLNYYTALKEGRELSVAEKFKHHLAKALVLNKVKQAIGFDRAYYLISGSAPIAPDILEFFYSLDLPIMEGYGLSESLGTCSLGLTEPHRFKIGSVGKIRDMNKVIIKQVEGSSEGEGEILIKGRNVCMGYLRMPEETDKTIDDDGWLHTGDLGKLDSEGFLYVTGRLKELVITAGGENIPPILIEEAIKKELPCVSNAMLVGDKRKYLTILLTFKSMIDPDSGEPLDELTSFCQSWLRENGCEAKTVKEAIDKIKDDPDGSLSKAIQEGISRYNTHHAISNAQKVQRWSFLPHDFSLPTGELNNTLKLRRAFAHEKYSQVIDSMYSVGETNKV